MRRERAIISIFAKYKARGTFSAPIDVEDSSLDAAIFTQMLRCQV